MGRIFKYVMLDILKNKQEKKEEYETYKIIDIKDMWKDEMKKIIIEQKFVGILNSLAIFITGNDIFFNIACSQ